MHRFSCWALLVQIKCKTCHFDRVDLTTRVNTIICQSDILNKIRLKTLKVHRFLRRDFCFRILSHETPNGYYEWNVDHKMWCNVRRLVSHSLTELACDLNLKKKKKNTHIYQNLLGFHLTQLVKFLVFVSETWVRILPTLKANWCLGMIINLQSSWSECYKFKFYYIRDRGVKLDSPNLIEILLVYIDSWKNISN